MADGFAESVKAFRKLTLQEPATTENFLVTMWEATGPGDLTSDSDLMRAGAGLASAAVSAAGQFFFGRFSAVEGLQTSLEVEEYHEGGHNLAPHTFYKHGKPTELTFKRGVTSNVEIWDWYNQVLRGKRPALRKSGMILLVRPNYAPVAAWLFHRGLPTTLSGSNLDARSRETAIETLGIKHEGLERVSFSLIPGLADAGAMLGGVLGMGTSSLKNIRG